MQRISVGVRLARSGRALPQRETRELFHEFRVTIHESLVTIPISATDSGEAAESGVASVSE